MEEQEKDNIKQNTASEIDKVTPVDSTEIQRQRINLFDSVKEDNKEEKEAENIVLKNIVPDFNKQKQFNISNDQAKMYLNLAKGMGSKLSSDIKFTMTSVVLLIVFIIICGLIYIMNMLYHNPKTIILGLIIFSIWLAISKIIKYGIVNLKNKVVFFYHSTCDSFSFILSKIKKHK